MKWLLSLMFIARVTIPMGQKVVYDNVRDIIPFVDGAICLVLEDGKKVIVPVMFTVIEEK